MYNLKLELYLSRTATTVTVDDPILLTTEIMDQAWSMMDAFVMDLVDKLVPDVSDERFRELFIEVCYKLIYREMTTLHLLPIWDENWKNRLGTNKRGPRVKRVSQYEEFSNE